METIISQALTGLEISRREYKSILKEQKNYKRLNKNFRNIKGNNDLNEKAKELKTLEKKVKMHKIKKTTLS